ncbi:MAG: contractile injection system tape measure protein [Bacteroidota bacterium]
MTHHIRQQYLHLELSASEPEGQRMQQLIPDIFYEKLLPALEKVFDQSVPADRLLKIDRLDIDAGSIPLDRVDKDLTEAVLKELTRIFHEEGYNRTPDQESVQSNGVVLKNSHENTVDIFFYFLETGSLPWNTGLPDSKPLHEVVIEAVREIMKGGGIHLFNKNLRKSLSDQGALVRLGNQFPSAFHAELLSLIAPPVSGLSRTILSSGEMQQFSAPARDTFIKSIITAAFTYFSGTESPSGEGFRSYLLSTVPEKQDEQPSIKRMLNSGTKHKNNKSGQETLQKIQKPTTDIVPEMDPVYIRNAGLILLHPFLPSFFEDLRVANGDDMLSPEKALQLLGYLVTGNLKTPEYDLFLPKILCGIPVTKPLAGECTVSEQESAEGIVLIDAVIGHWEALRDTSADGFRGSFLYRPGKLSRSKSEGWILQVETRTWDILLDQLPWGISLIGLPWMKEVLSVEWNY